MSNFRLFRVSRLLYEYIISLDFSIVLVVSRRVTNNLSKAHVTRDSISPATWAISV